MLTKYKKALCSVLVASIACLFMPILSTPAYAAGGSVQCPADTVVGLWIEVSGGISGWAKLEPTPDSSISAFSYDTQGKEWRGHVGCGGTPENWGYTIYTNWTREESATITCISPIICRVG